MTTAMRMVRQAPSSLHDHSCWLDPTPAAASAAAGACARMHAPTAARGAFARHLYLFCAGGAWPGLSDLDLDEDDRDRHFALGVPVERRLA